MLHDCAEFNTSIRVIDYPLPVTMLRAEGPRRKHMSSNSTRRFVSLVVVSLSLVGIGAHVASTAAAVAPASTTITQPSRILDTRIGLGAPQGKLIAGQILRLQVPAAVAKSASTVVINITATASDANGWVKAWPCSADVPPTSVLNFATGRTSANLAMLQMTAGGVCLTTNSPVQLIADLSGWFAGSDDFNSSPSSRVLDTRGSGNPLVPGEERQVKIAGTPGIDGSANVAALNVTVVSRSTAGWVVAYPCGSSTNGSSVNFSAGEEVAGFTTVGLIAGNVCIRSNTTVDIVVDTYGWSFGTGSLRVQSPNRLLDTRDPSWTFGQVPNGGRVQLRVAGTAGIPIDAAAALLTITVANTSGDGYVTVWPCDQPLPSTSTINTWSNQFRSNLGIVSLSATDGTACLQLSTANGSSIDLVVDAIGWVTGGPNRMTGASTTPTNFPATTTVPSAGVSPAVRPFAASSPFNTPIPAGTPWFDDSALHVTPPVNGDTRRHWWVAAPFGIYYSKTTDPVWTFNMPAVDGGPSFHRSRAAHTDQVHAPSNIAPGNDVDKVLIVVENTTYYEIWNSSLDTTNHTVTGSVWSTGDIVTGPGAGTMAANDGVRAANFSWAAGLITGRDLTNPTIDHALAIALPGDVLDGHTDQGYVYPATAWDNGGSTGKIKAGSRLGIPTGTPQPAGLSPLGIKMFNALTTYGAYVGDFVGGPWPTFYADANTVNPNSTTISSLYAFWNNNGSADMDKIAPLLRIANYQP
jgi:hypothetical protein